MKKILFASVLSIAFLCNSHTGAQDIQKPDGQSLLQEKVKNMEIRTDITNDTVNKLLNEKKDYNSELQKDVSDPVVASLYVFMRFIDANAQLAGNAKACNIQEVDAIERCTNLTISHWKDITSVDLNKIRLNDGDDSPDKFKELVKREFTEKRDESYNKMMKNQQLCPSFNLLEQSAPLWDICKRDPNSFPKPTTDGLDSKYDNTYLQ